MAAVALVLAVVLLPVVVWLTFLGVRRTMKSRGDQHGMRSDRVLMRRDLAGLGLTGVAFAYWHGVDLDPVSLMWRALNAVLITSLAALLATIGATIVLVLAARGRRRETFRQCSVVFVALAPFLFFVVTYVALGESEILGGDGPWASMISILASASWLTLMPTTIYYAFRYGFRIGEAPQALLPLVAIGTALVCLARSSIRVSANGFLEGFPPWVGALIAFGGPIAAIVIVVVWDLLPLRRPSVVARGDEPDARPVGA